MPHRGDRRRRRPGPATTARPGARDGHGRALDGTADRTLTDARYGFHSKLLNATQHDLGIGNIKLGTAKRMYDQYQSTFERKDMKYADLVQYLKSL